jgi:hypothetical protein
MMLQRHHAGLDLADLRAIDPDRAGLIEEIQPVADATALGAALESLEDRLRPSPAIGHLGGEAVGAGLQGDVALRVPRDRRDPPACSRQAGEMHLTLCPPQDPVGKIEEPRVEPIGVEHGGAERLELRQCLIDRIDIARLHPRVYGVQSIQSLDLSQQL